MTELEHKALLPAGLRDVLPPGAAFEAGVMEGLIAHFAASGYERVKAPLVEFEEGLMSGAGAAMSGHTFRLMDPESQRMMGVRADITPQIARIAATRLRQAPRPLRLSYSGEVLRVKGTQLRPQRQFAQVGAELIGCEQAAADTEIIVLAAESLGAVGVTEISVDLTIPPLVPALCDSFGLGGERLVRLRHALDHKDAAAVAELGDGAAAVLQTLLAAAGPAERCLDVLASLELPEAASRERARVTEVVARIGAISPHLSLTVDPVENRGFEYHTGVSFAIFPADGRGELGGGGRYAATVNGSDDGGGEPATGFTLYVDDLLRILPEPEPARRVFVPAGADAGGARGLREEGWVTVAGLETVADASAEASRLGCTHLLEDGKARPAV